ncbi:ATP-binding cassette domain-containing protein [Nonomuraea sp. GTA35]|uniref:ATP-binding cassette domain-containing protein n=1 Tax=Nonomuraea sp. GTA35 TaxID=1676746 RepID=UPI0035C093B6
MLGRSGCGKSTILNLLAGLTTPAARASSGTTRGSCPAECAGGSACPGCRRATPGRCSWTSRSARSTPSSAPSCRPSCCGCGRTAGRPWCS